uniref:Endonuclease/exonuclease/phosphatase domain-containing protein n=1 Tax=Sinocyclocheilus grahami TaxID=75366 RepID=A0A672MKF5_SINGR
MIVCAIANGSLGGHHVLNNRLSVEICGPINQVKTAKKHWKDNAGHTVNLADAVEGLQNKTNEIQCTMTSKQTGTHRLRRRPVIQGPRPQLGNRGWVERLATGVEGKGEGEKKLKAATDFLKIGTWNVRTLRSPGKLELLRKEMTPYECDILGLSEMRWTGVGELNGGEVIWSGEEKNHMRGVGFLLSKRAKDALLGYNPVNSRNIVARFNGAPLNIAVIQVYAPTSDSTEEEVETFYGQLEHTIEELPKKDVKIVIGDWNAKVGTDNLGWEQVMGCHGYGQRNNRGERLLEFASKNDLLITNTRFQQKDSRKWTWMAPDGKYTNMINLVLVDRRWKTAVRVCRTFQGADISSDHSLVMYKLKLRLKRTTRQQLHEPRRNINALGNAMVRGVFKDKVEQRLANSPSQPVELNDRVRRLNEAKQSSVREVLPTVCHLW